MNFKLIIVTTGITLLIASSVLAQGGRHHFNQNNTPGWTLMTSEERTEHQKNMFAAKTYKECKAIQAEHHKIMEARAAEKGETIYGPKENACDRMKVQGILK